jgi:predicted lipase
MEKEVLLKLAKWSRVPYQLQDHWHNLKDVRILPSSDPSIIRGLVAQTKMGLVVSIKGTQNIRDLFTDFKASKKTFLGGYRVHEGFLGEYNIIWPQLKKDTHQPIYVTGHSAGGAVATLLALAMNTQWGINPIVATFGSPRVGDHLFTKYYNLLIPNTTRVVHNLDIVPRVPSIEYAHVDTLLHLNRRGHIIGPFRTWFDQIFEESVSVFDGLAFRNHHIATYVDCVRNMK